MESVQEIPKGIDPFNKLYILAGLLCIFALLWFFVLAPYILKIPSDFSYSADVTSVDNFYDETIEAFRGEQYSKTDFSYKVVSANGNQLVIKNTFHVQTLDGKTIFKAEPLYGINALTGEHINGLGDADREGYLFAPRDVKKGQNFTYWHADSNRPAEMQFVDEETLYGLKVYKYTTNYGGEIDQTAALGFLPNVGVTRGVKLLSTNNIWIEPVTGYMVKQEDFSDDYYFYDLQTGDIIAPYNKFLNIFTEESIKAHVEIANQKKNFTLFIQYVVPGLLLFLIAIIIFLRFNLFRISRRLFLHNIISLSVLLTMLSLTFVSYKFINQSIYLENENQLIGEAQEVKGMIENRMSVYLSALLGGRALFNASSSVERDEWNTYVDTLKFSENYPGIQGMGYIKIVKPSDKNNFIQSVRSEGLVDFNISPAGDREIYAPVLFIEPLVENNQSVLGFDMFSWQHVKESMIKARDSGEPTMSGKLNSTQGYDSSSIGEFIAFLPVYKIGSIVESVEDRQNSIEGYVYIPFRIDDLMMEVFNDRNINLTVDIYDGLNIYPDSSMYSFGNQATVSSNQNIFFRKIETIYIAGHPWTLEYINTQNFEGSSAERSLLMFDLFGGLALSFLFYGFIYSLLRSRSHAIEYAKELTKDIDQKNKNLETKVKELDLMNRAMIDREVKMAEMKKQLNRKNS